MHLLMTGKIYLHEGDVFALDICLDLYLQPFDYMDDLFSAFCAKTHKLGLSFLCFHLCLFMFSVCRPTVRSVCLLIYVFYIFLLLFSNKMKNSILFHGGTKQFNLAH